MLLLCYSFCFISRGHWCADSPKEEAEVQVPSVQGEESLQRLELHAPLPQLWGQNFTFHSAILVRPRMFLSNDEIIWRTDRQGNQCGILSGLLLEWPWFNSSLSPPSSPQDFANQVRWSTAYIKECRSAQIKPGRFVTPNTGEFLSGGKIASFIELLLSIYSLVLKRLRFFDCQVSRHGEERGVQRLLMFWCYGCFWH